MNNTDWATADLSDDYPDRISVVRAPLLDFGGVRRFAGVMATLRVHEDFRPVLGMLSQPGRGRVLVVDGGGSIRHAVLGERLATQAVENGWVGVVVYGAVRDTDQTAKLAVGVRALAAVPSRGMSGDAGVVDIPLEFGEAILRPGDWLWADADGVVVGLLAVTSTGHSR